jgi:hypothetical protein
MISEYTSLLVRPRTSTPNILWTCEKLGAAARAKIDYWWVVKNANGLSWNPLSILVTDNRQLAEFIGEINIYWYEGNDNFAQSLMSTAQQSWSN